MVIIDTFYTSVNIKHTNICASALPTESADVQRAVGAQRREHTVQPQGRDAKRGGYWEQHH